MKDVQCRTCIRIRQGYCDGAEPDDMNRPCEFYKRMTNADRIRAMTDEELSEMFTEMYDDESYFYCPVKRCRRCPQIDCNVCFLDWLKQEVSE